MAGTPIRRERRQRLDGAEDDILALMASPLTLNQIAAKYSVGYRVLRKWMEETPERKDACESARKFAADAIAERALEMAQETRDKAMTGLCEQVEVNATKVAIDTDKWIAGVWNRSKYSDRKETSVNINLGKLHLDALRHISIDSSVNSADEES